MEILFPLRCPVCDTIVVKGRIHERCRERLYFVKEPVCKKCGKPLEREERELCDDCKIKKHEFLQGKSVFLYKGDMKKSIYAFKYRKRQEYAKAYANEMILSLEWWIRKIQPEAILPIPIYFLKKKKRGYNQAELLADELGNYFKLPVEKRLLVRTRNTRPQKELSEQERRNNLKNAFKIVGNDVKLKKILMLDDIFTTGVTIDSAAQVLKDAGVEEIYVISLCIGNN